jgi:beta-lactam-binding protein with PASTA domain
MIQSDDAINTYRKRIMNGIFKAKLLSHLLPMIPLLVVSTNSWGTVLPVPAHYEERLGTLSADFEKISRELKNLQARLSGDIRSDATEAEYQKDIETLFQLMHDLNKNKKAMHELKEQLNDLFTAPPALKLVRISGPEPGTRPLNALNAYGAQEEILFTTNGSGCARKLIDRTGQLRSSTAVSVTYAPLEIIPGEPFHFEVEARAAAYWDQPQDCSAYDPLAMGVEIDPDNSFASPTWAVSKANLRCEPGSVKISMRFKPEPPVSPPPHDYYAFPYMMEAVTDGRPVKGRPFGPLTQEIHHFRLRTRKSDISLSDRERYKLDVKVTAPVFDEPYGNAPYIVLHYKAQDESIGFLPQYQFPEDSATQLIAVPDLQGLTEREAVDILTRRRLDAGIHYGRQAPSSKLCGKVASQDPIPDTNVKLHSRVEVTLYSDHMVVPDFRGKPLADAKNWLRDNDFKEELKAAGPAASSDQTGTVGSQEPSPGKTLMQGQPLKLWVYGPPNPNVTVPALGNVSVEEAKNALAGLGLKFRLSALGSAPSSDLSFKVKETDPQAGTQVPTGTEVMVKVYGQYSATREEQVARMDCSRYPGSRAFWDEAAGSPACGCFDGLTWNSNRSRCIATEAHANPICARDYPGTTAQVSDADGKINCACPQGSVWNSAQRQCERQLSPEELCARDYPGSVPSGTAPDGSINCVCPQGYDWTADRRQCVKQTVGGGDQKEAECSWKLTQIKMFMNNFRANPSNTFQKQMAENIANQARLAGCDQAAIAAALGSSGGIGQGGGAQRSGGQGSGGIPELEPGPPDPGVSPFGQ